MMSNTEEQPSNMAAATMTSANNSNAGTPTTPVQVVKPTVRTDKEAAACQKMPDAFNFVPIRLSTNKMPAKDQHVAVTEPILNSSASEAQGDAEGQQDCGDAEFEWNDYLDSADAIAAPPTLFPHVESSLQNLFTRDMKLEIPTRHFDGTFWVASVIMPCGPLLRLRYEGYGTDRSADFWCEIASGEIHPVGWSMQNNKILKPPPAIRHKYQDWDEFLRNALDGATTIPTYLLQASGSTAVDQIMQGMKLEIQDKINLTHLWIATVIENIGGRLLLRYDGMQASAYDFWLFYLNYRVHPVGWSKGMAGYEYRPPTGTPLSSPEWEKVLQESLSQAEKQLVPTVIFKTQEKIVPHNFRKGMKLEAINCSTLMQISPATVTKVLSPLYFIVGIDQPPASAGETSSQQFGCHANSPAIFPVGWAKDHGLTVAFPKGSQQVICPDMSWEDYLAHQAKESGQKAPEVAPVELFHNESLQNGENGFEEGMKLEAANPFQPNQICAATISKVAGNLLWIQLDNLHSTQPNHIAHANSLEIFPVGWCDSNHYPLKIPLAFQQAIRVAPPKKVAIVMPEKQKSGAMEGQEEDYGFVKDVREMQATGKAWCPEIYVNHKCFSGPFLSKGRIAGLPRHVGPGPVTLVLKEIISMIVGVSYQSGRALSILQAQGEPTPGMQQQLIKAKCKLKTYRAMVEIIRSSDKVEEYCRSICRKLQCCPNLFGPNFYGDNCPENCYTLTKTNPNQMVKRRKKRRKNKALAAKLLRQSQQKSPSPDKDEEKMEEDVNNTNSNSNEDKDYEDGEAGKPKKRKYKHRIVPKSDIVTRGAKLPNYALELNRKRRHSGYMVTLHQKSHDSDFDQQDKGYHHKRSKTGVPQAEDGESQINQPVHEILQLDSNPLQWSVEEVETFIKNTDCSGMAHLLKEQEIDGQALLLLSLPAIQEHLELKLGPAIKLCHQIERVKLAFYSQFAN